jgi:predicted transcriptional regulator
MTDKRPGPGGTKNLLLRLDPELAERLQTVAEVEGRSVSDVVREAVARLVEQRRKDKRFSQLLDENLARHRRLLELLRDGDDREAGR